jgi:hypothetical protein
MYALNQSINSNYSTLNTNKPDITLYDDNNADFVDISSSNGRLFLRIYKSQKRVQFYYKDVTHTGAGWDNQWTGALS